MPANNLPKTTFSALNALVKDYIADGCPAVAIAVFQQGELMLNRAWGRVDAQHSASTNTRFDLASLTKLFTTTAFLSLLSESNLQLDDPVVSVIPEFGGDARPVDGGVDPHSQQPLPLDERRRGMKVKPSLVTFRHLLTHTSGLAAWRPVYEAAGSAPTLPDHPDPISRAERWKRGLAFICQSPFVAAPDGVVRYSDLGLMLLGEAAARLFRGELDEAIRVRILARATLPSITFNPVRDYHLATGLIAPTEEDVDWRGRRLHGEVHDENASGVGGVAGHAGLFGTAHDVARFGMFWLHQPHLFGIHPELSAAAVRQQVQTDNVRRGLGWMLKSPQHSSAGDYFSADSFGHIGFTGTSLWIDPQRALVVACLTNAVYAGRDVYDPHPFRQAVHNLLGQLPPLAAHGTYIRPTAAVE